MSEQAPQIQRAELAAHSPAFAEALGAELSARLGRKLTLQGSAAQNVGVLELADSDDALVHQALRFTGAKGEAHVLLPQRDAALLAALERGASAEELEAAQSGPLDEAATASLAQVMESVADVMRRSFESAGMPGLALEATRVVTSPQSEPTWLDDTFYVRMRFTQTLEGLAPGRLDLLFRKSDLVGEAARARTICFVTLGDAHRKRIAEIEGELGASAITLEPRELAEPLDQRVLEASAIVIPWDLAGRSGLELAEALAREGRRVAAPILLGAPRPTRAQLLAALRAGARGVIPDPFDPAAIRALSEPPVEAAQ